MAYVFLSYDHEDAALARPLAAALEKAGHQVWYDRHIHGGAQYSRQIEKELDSADAVIVLWSPRSLESAWVRDEAAEGRDREKLVPLSVEDVTAPIGFRQFQTIPLGRWSGRGRLPRLAEILAAVESQAVRDRSGEPAPVARSAIHAPPPPPERPRWMIPALAILLLAAAGFGAWKLFGGSGLPVVEIAAADPSERSQGAASDLFVKLGTLAKVGDGKWQLVDMNSRNGKSDFLFRTAASTLDGHPQGNIVLIDGKDNSLLWSREFGSAETSDSVLRQQMALVAGRVLGCALESREDGGIPKALVKIFLNACASLAEVGWEKSAVIAPLRQVVKANPKFRAGWSYLLAAETDSISFDQRTGDRPEIAQLRQDIVAARKADPDLAEASLAEVTFAPIPPIAPAMKAIDDALARNPNNARLLSFRAGQLAMVGRMAEAAEAARRATELDPLSPEQRFSYILALAYSGEVDAARKELARAKADFPGAKTIEQAEMSLELRYGDFEKAMAAQQQFPGTALYIAMRKNPTEENVQRFRAIRPTSAMIVPQLVFGLAAFTEAGKVDDAYDLLESPIAPDFPTSEAYLFFRSYMKPFREDPRFLPLMKKLKLLEYWKESGEWPDYCRVPVKAYDCATEAAKLG